MPVRHKARKCVENNKSEIKKGSALLLVVAITFGISVSLQSLLAAWSAPTAAPTGGNVPEPINVGSANQTMTGGLGVGGNFTVTGNSAFSGTLQTTRKGMGGTYDSYQVQGVWSIAPNYAIDTTNNTFGSQYGIVYAHPNAGTGSAKQPITGWGHQMHFTSNGTSTAAVSLTSGYGYFANKLTVGTTTVAGVMRLYTTGATSDYMYIDADYAQQSAISFRDNTNGQDIVTYRPGNTRDYRIYTTTAGDVFSITQSGNIGVKETAPNAPLTIRAASTADQALYQSWRYAANSDQYALKLKQTVTSGVVRYTYDMINNNTAYNNVLTLDRGNVGIGITDPTSKLQVFGDLRVGNPAFKFYTTSTGSCNAGDIFVAKYTDGVSCTGVTCSGQTYPASCSIPAQLSNVLATTPPSCTYTSACNGVLNPGYWYACNCASCCDSCGYCWACEPCASCWQPDYWTYPPTYSTCASVWSRTLCVSI